MAIISRSTIELDETDPLGAALPGTETVILNLARGLADQGVPVTVYARFAGASMWGAELAPLSELPSLVDSEDLRVLWVRDYHLPDAVFDRLPRASHYLLTEDSAHDMSVLLRKPMDEVGTHLRDYLPNFRTVVFASRWHVADWSARLGVDAPHAEPVYNLASHVAWAERPVVRGAQRLVHTSHPRKAIAAVAAVAERLSRRGYHFVCTGAPHLYQDPDCRVMCPDGRGGWRDLGMFGEFAQAHRAAIEFRPPRPARGMGAFLDEFDLLLHPDYSEETGATTVIEALRRGVVPVVSTVGALPELVGDAGVLVAGEPWTDVFADACAAAIEGLGPDDLARLAEARDARRAELDTGPILDRWRAVLDL